MSQCSSITLIYYSIMSPLRGFPFLLLNNAPCHACIKISSLSSFHVFTYSFTALPLHLCSYMTQDEILSDHPSFAHQTKELWQKTRRHGHQYFYFLWYVCFVPACRHWLSSFNQELFVPNCHQHHILYNHVFSHFLKIQQNFRWEGERSVQN